jgi:hypothetical protein
MRRAPATDGGCPVSRPAPAPTFAAALDETIALAAIGPAALPGPAPRPRRRASRQTLAIRAAIRPSDPQAAAATGYHEQGAR